MNQKFLDIFKEFLNAPIRRSFIVERRVAKELAAIPDSKVCAMTSLKAD